MFCKLQPYFKAFVLKLRTKPSLSGLTNLIALHNEMAVFVGKRRASTVIYLDISKAFNAVPPIASLQRN